MPFHVFPDVRSRLQPSLPGANAHKGAHNGIGLVNAGNCNSRFRELTSAIQRALNQSVNSRHSVSRSRRWVHHIYRVEGRFSG